MNIGGGVALLLWGTRMVRTGMVRGFGGELRRAIAIGTRNRILAFGAGLGVTALLQSATATALIVASFVGRNLLAQSAALAVMLGADLGTALVARLLSLDLQWAWSVLVIAGVATFALGQATRQKDIGRAILGLGLMLLALRLIVATAAPLQESELFGQIVRSLGGEPLLALATAALLTWLLHSSLAMVLLVASLAGAGLLPVGLACVLVLGANLGGGLPALTATLAQPVPARRVTLGNLVFRTVGIALALPALGFVLPLLPWLGAGAASQTVGFHVAFNAGLALVFLPLTGLVGRLAVKLLPERPTADQPSKPRYLDASVVDTPSVALALAARETLRMGDIVEDMLRKSLQVIRSDDRKLAKEVERTDDIVDALHEAIKLFLTQISREGMDESESRRYVEIVAFTTNLEHVGDIIDKNLMELAAKKIRNKLSFSPEGQAEIVALHDRVIDHLKLALSVFVSGDIKTARQLLEEKVHFRDLERAAAENHLARLRSGQVQTLETSSLHLDVVRDLKRIHSHIASVAYPILEAAGELRPSRLRKQGASAAGAETGSGAEPVTKLS